jgi:hypothetical protein
VEIRNAVEDTRWDVPTPLGLNNAMQPLMRGSRSGINVELILEQCD